MSVPSATPFIYGPPVTGAYFLDRQEPLATIMGRAAHPHKPQSTAVVGQPHVGKSSLLHKLADPSTWQPYVEGQPHSLLAHYCDLHAIPLDFTPAAFWQEVLSPISRHPLDRGLTTRLARAAGEQYNRHALQRLFDYLAHTQQRRLFLLLDEFERLLRHPGFSDPAFFAGLRSLSNNSDGLALVIAGRMTVDEMNRVGRGLLDTGSPFFNTMIEVRLLPFDAPTTTQLLERAGDAFTGREQAVIGRMAGPSPYLLQAMAANLYALPAGPDRLERAAANFYHQIGHHFSDLWGSLDDATCTVAVLLALADVGNTAFGRNFANKDIAHPDRFDVELRRLAELGLAERVAQGRWPWRRENWRLSAATFGFWLYDNIIRQARPLPEVQAWLEQQRYRVFLTEDQWQRLVGGLREARLLAAETLAVFIRNLVEELTGTRLP